MPPNDLRGDKVPQGKKIPPHLKGGAAAVKCQPLPVGINAVRSFAEDLRSAGVSRQVIGQGRKLKGSAESCKRHNKGNHALALTSIISSHFVIAWGFCGVLYERLWLNS